MSDHEAMLAIQQQLNGVEWTPDTLSNIEQILISAGYHMRDLNDADREAAS